MSQQLQSALRLARMGFRVFPLIPGDKKPAVSRFPIVATTDETQINAWWNYRPDYNVGVSTNGFVVVDVDTKKGEHAVDNFRRVGGDFGTFVVRTATGGYHAYYHGPESKLAVDIVPGVDIRSHGGFVVGPGSVTSSANEGCVTGEYTVYNEAPMLNVPLEVELLLEPPGSVRQRNDNAEVDEPASIANATTWLQVAEPAVEGHGGNSATFRVCAKLVRDFALTEDTAYQLLLTHWNHRCLPPWSSGELLNIIRNAAAYGTSDLGAASPSTIFGNVTIVEAPKPEAPYVWSPQGVFMGNAVPVMYQTPRPWVVERMLMNGEVTVLGGVGSAGKSMFQLVAAAHFAVGKDFGDFKLKVPGLRLRSLIYNGEDDAMEMGRRMAAICQCYGLNYEEVTANIAFMDDRQGELMLASQQHGVPIMDKQAMQFILNTGSQCDVDIIWFDPMVNIHQLDENNNAHMRFLITVMKTIGRELNCAIMVSHHTGKGGMNKEKGDADAFRGASALINSARIALLLSGLTAGDKTKFGVSEQNASDYMRVDVGKTNMFKKDGQALAWLKWETVQHFNGDFIGVPTLPNMTKREADQNLEIGRIIRDALRANSSGSMLRTDAVRAIKESGHILASLSDSALRNLLGKMLAKALAVDNDVLVIEEIDGKQLIKLA